MNEIRIDSIEKLGLGFFSMAYVCWAAILNPLCRCKIFNAKILKFKIR